MRLEGLCQLENPITSSGIEQENQNAEPFFEEAMHEIGATFSKPIKNLLDALLRRAGFRV
jgi:hypothetical protein